MAVPSAGAQPAFHTTKATAVNIVARGNVVPSQGVSNWRARTAPAIAPSAMPICARVEGGRIRKKCRTKTKGGGLFRVRPLPTVELGLLLRGVSARHFARRQP